MWDKEIPSRNELELTAKYNKMQHQYEVTWLLKCNKFSQRITSELIAECKQLSRTCFARIVSAGCPPGVRRALLFENSAWLQRPFLTFTWLLSNYKTSFLKMSVLIPLFKTKVCYKTHIDWHNSATSITHRACECDQKRDLFPSGLQPRPQISSGE